MDAPNQQINVSPSCLLRTFIVVFGSSYAPVVAVVSVDMLSVRLLDILDLDTHTEALQAQVNILRGRALDVNLVL